MYIVFQFILRDAPVKFSIFSWSQAVQAFNLVTVGFNKTSACILHTLAVLMKKFIRRGWEFEQVLLKKFIHARCHKVAAH